MIGPALPRDRRDPARSTRLAAPAVEARRARDAGAASPQHFISFAVGTQSQNSQSTVKSWRRTKSMRMSVRFASTHDSVMNASWEKNAKLIEVCGVVRDRYTIASR